MSIKHSHGRDIQQPYSENVGWKTICGDRRVRYLDRGRRYGRGADLSGGQQLPLCGTRNGFSSEREYGMNYITRRLLRLGIGVILGGGFVVVYHAITGHLPNFLR